MIIAVTEQDTGADNMLDYSEVLLSINANLKQLHNLLLSGNKHDAIYASQMIARQADRLSHWLGKELSK